MAYQKRFDIEEMFRDFKSGGYSLEGSQLPEFDVRKSARNQWSKELETFCQRNSILNKN
jgi:hypothetical protein